MVSPEAAKRIWRCVLPQALLARATRRQRRFIVFVGADGVGKTSLVYALEKRLRQAGFPLAQGYHCGRRPCFILSAGRGQQIATRIGMADERQDDCGRQRPHKATLSIIAVECAKLILYILDFWAMYFFKVHPLIRKGGFLLMDRYYYCNIVDTQMKSHWHLPLPVMKFVARLIPKEDLIIMLYDTPEIIHARKAELSPEEIRQYQAAYEALGAGREGFVKIRTDGGIEKVTDRALEEIMAEIKE